ncbi:MAG TPA: hypothetical protein VGD42_01210 [Lysobacter sp.]
MQSRRFIAYRGAVGLGVLLLAGVASAQQVPATDLPAAFVESKVEAQAQPDAPLPLQPGAMGAAVDIGELADLRGGTQVVDNDILVNGRVEDNVADDVLTGNNAITAGSFANANGISTVIQNTGANVLIQNAMIVNVKFAGSGP